MVHSQQVSTTSEVNILVVQDLRKTRAYKLDRLLLTVGRSKQADIQILSQEVSRIHATLLRVRNAHGDPQYRLIDGDARRQQPSQNGTFVNGQRVRSYDLKNRDEISFCSRSKARFFQFSDQMDPNLETPSERWKRPEDNMLEAQSTTSIDLEAALAAEGIEHSTGLSPLLPEELMALQTRPPAEPNIHFQGNRIQKHSRLGEFFVRANKIKPEVLQDLLTQQRNSKKRLGELLVEEELVSPEELQKALRNQRICLGEILLYRQLISAEHLKMALVEQVSSHQPLGSILLAWGWIKEEDLEDALQEQYLRHKGLWFIQ
ncbi:MAG: FHA domain-containing protein [Prochlorothrix sp.]